MAVVALLSALNANLYGASRMVYSLSERGEAPGFLSKLSKARVPVVAVGVSVAFGFMAAVLELLFPEQILPALFQLVGSTCLVVWGSALVSQLILRRRADRDGTALPLRMKGFPGLTVFGLVLLALIFAVGFSSPESSRQLFSTFVLVAGIAAACWIGARITRRRSAAPRRVAARHCSRGRLDVRTAPAAVSQRERRPPDCTNCTRKPTRGQHCAVWSATRPADCPAYRR